LRDKCLACNQINCLIYFNEKDKILSCNECGAIQLEHEMKNDRFNIEYTTEPSFFERFVNRMTYVKISEIPADAYIQYLKSKTDMNFKNVLDVGAKFGVFVDKLNKMGINAYGIEALQEYVKLAVTKKIKCAYFDKNSDLETKYDLICLTQMIYYIRDNYALFDHVKNMLTANGLIFVSTVNPLSSLLHEFLLPQAANMILSRKNFESLHEKLRLELIDYTTYSTNHYFDVVKSKYKKITALKYYLKLRESYTLDPNGNEAFLLLKPS